jgi:hypothetical protein
LGLHLKQNKGGVKRIVLMGEQKRESGNSMAVNKDLEIKRYQDRI